MGIRSIVRDNWQHGIAAVGAWITVKQWQLADMATASGHEKFAQVMDIYRANGKGLQLPQEGRELLDQSSLDAAASAAHMTNAKIGGAMVAAGLLAALYHRFNRDAGLEHEISEQLGEPTEAAPERHPE